MRKFIVLVCAVLALECLLWGCASGKQGVGSGE
jgi:predicted small secreted protein